VKEACKKERKKKKKKPSFLHNPIQSRKKNANHSIPSLPDAKTETKRNSPFAACNMPQTSTPSSPHPTQARYGRTHSQHESTKAPKRRDKKKEVCMYVGKYISNRPGKKKPIHPSIHPPFPPPTKRKKATENSRTAPHGTPFPIPNPNPTSHPKQL